MADNKKILPEPVSGANLGFNQGAAEETYTGKETVNGGQLFTGDVDTVTGTRQETFVQGQRGVLGIDDEVNKVTQGSDDIRDSMTIANNNLSEAGQMTDDDQAAADGAVDIDAEFENLKEMSANINTFTNQDNEAIADAEAAERARFAPLIEEAQERARQGMAESTVATGRKGGFMRARYAGQAALGETRGDVGYRGAGGKLELVESAFQRNIDNLKAQQQRAISLAKSAARQAIQSKKSADFDRAQKIFDTARQLREDQRAMDAAKAKAVADAREEEREEVRFQVETIQSIIETQGEVAEGQEFQIGDQTFVGTKVPDEEKAFFSGSNIISLMTSLPAGQEQTIEDPNTGTEFTIVGLKDPTTVQATDDQGNLSIIDKRTGQVLSKVQGVGKTKTQAPSVSLTMQADTRAIKQSITNNLESARDSETGNISEADYANQYLTFVNSDLGDVGDFRAQYPPNMYFSEEDAKEINKVFSEAEANTSALKDDDDDAFEFKPVGE